MGYSLYFRRSHAVFHNDRKAAPGRSVLLFLREKEILLPCFFSRALLTNRHNVCYTIYIVYSYIHIASMGRSTRSHCAQREAGRCKAFAVFVEVVPEPLFRNGVSTPRIYRKTRGNHPVRKKSRVLPLSSAPISPYAVLPLDS